ncbi:hypothetical protein [Butyrivibrio sp. WCD2001]|uniref:hypothetical protein n=1 Tax=Butyrivibrio sp. WCD2001 TaxID=1280681 RepID=UPI00040576A1|nr:hypothetical protein [Butyrivibrio sp. WCD2001]
MMTEHSKKLYGGVVIYLSLPIIIFILTWVKPFISVPAIAIIAFVIFRALRDKENSLELPIIGKKEKEVIIFAIIIITLWVYFSGIGKFVFQNVDHIYRNAIFEMLVNNRWPIVKEYIQDGQSNQFMLVYYIGFWLPAALIGKLFGLAAGYCFQAVWAVLGIFLFYLLICCYFKKISLAPLIIFIFFSGLDVIGKALVDGQAVSIFTGDHLEWWAAPSQFSSFTTQLFWVFNQSIPAWILILLIILSSKNRYVIFYLGIGLIFCPFPFIGLLPFVAYIVVRNGISYKDYQKVFRDLFSIENVLGGGITGILTYLYYKSNSSGQYIVFIPAKIPYRRGFTFCVVLFLLLEIGVYLVAIFKYQKNNPLLYIAMLVLCTCPLVQVGYESDYCMRACIPGQVVLFLLVTATLIKAWQGKDIVVATSICIILLIGSITPIHEINRTIQQTRQSYLNQTEVYASTATEEELMVIATNFRGDAEESDFCQYIMR